MQVSLGQVIMVFFLSFFDDLGTFVSDPASFLFSLKNAYNQDPKKYNKLDSDDKALYCHPSQGPTFGDIELMIANSCNSNTSSYVNMKGKSYENDKTFKEALFDHSAEPGNSNPIKITEYEVYGRV